METMFSSKTVEWETPQELFDILDAGVGFTLDPCCRKETAKCKKFYTEEDNGLSKSWKGEAVFMNPPYGREISKWLRKAWEESLDKNTIVVCLIPARTDTKWWHDYVMHSSKVIFLKGRLKFKKWIIFNKEYILDKHNKPNVSAPFPSAIVTFNGTKYLTQFAGWDWRDDM